MPMPPQSPVIEDPRILARYPFLPQAVKHTRDILDNNDITMEGLLTDGWLSDIRRRGDLRVKESILHDDGIGIPSSDLSKDLGRMTKII